MNLLMRAHRKTRGRSLRRAHSPLGGLRISRRLSAPLVLYLVLNVSMGPQNAHPVGPPGLKLRSTSVPEGLVDAWIRFHETELCQQVDAVWLIHERGAEVWCKLVDEKDYQKLLALLEPSAARVEIYAARPDPEMKAAADRQPPPSIWNNSEIRDFLQDPFSRGSSQAGITIRPRNRSEPDGDYFLRQRMLMFAEQTLDWEVKMKRYAADLPGLVEVSLSKTVEPALRTRAFEACQAHAKGVDKYADKLEENLEIALPKAGRRFRSPETSRTEKVLPAPGDIARQVDWGARSIASRVYRFIHPEQHTVGLIDLREPSLLESLKTLRGMVSDFEVSLRDAH